ncbi:MAG: hypothetical protein ACW9XH_04420 [Candidatus Nitrosopumilus sp. bin_32a]
MKKIPQRINSPILIFTLESDTLGICPDGKQQDHFCTSVNPE